MITLYHQTKIPIGFLCRSESKPRFFIQPLETLSIKLTCIYRLSIKKKNLYLMVIFVCIRLLAIKERKKKPISSAHS